MELDDRKVVILTTIIKNYLETGEPVGSRTISKYSGLNLSSATIRNEMSDLEEMGYIVQPHTSAGRIPSDKGYRFYVNQLMQSQKEEINEVKSEMFRKVDHLETALQNLVRNLASDTHYAALASGPDIARNKIRFIQISIVDQRRLLLVVMMEGNIVRTSTVVLDGSEELDFNTVLSLNLLLNDELDGLSVQDITEGRCAQIYARSTYRNTLKAVVKSICSLLGMDQSKMRIYTSGATNIFKYPELSDGENAEKLISAFEQKDELKALVQTVSEDAKESKNPIQVYIGSESPVGDMKDVSVVTARYRLGGGMEGTIGVIGPKRMDYEKVLDILKKIQAEMDDAFK